MAGQGTTRRTLWELAARPASGWIVSHRLFVALKRKVSKVEAFEGWRAEQAAAKRRALKEGLADNDAPAPAPAGLRWAIVMPKPSGERQLVRAAQRHGLEACAPRERVVALSARIGAYVSERALLPGYVFVAHPGGLAIDFAALEAARGGGPPLMMGGAPVMVAGRVVEALSRAELAGAFCCVQAGLDAARAAKAKRYPAGTRLEIVSGPLAGLIGRVKLHKAKGRIALLIEASGSLASVDVEAGAVARAPEP